MTIFIPVLWICINANCEFMQQSKYFIVEAECTDAVRQQKQKMRDMAGEVKTEITVLEGTCIDATVKRMPQNTGEKQ